MQKKSLQTILYSTAGVAVMLVILIAFNFIAGTARARLDLTQEKAFTLSAGTRAILKKLDTPVTIRFYCTQSESATRQQRLPPVEPEQHGGDLAGRQVHRRHDHAIEEQAQIDRAEPAHRGGGFAGIAHLVEFQIGEHAGTAPQARVEKHRGHAGQREGPPLPIAGHSLRAHDIRHQVGRVARKRGGHHGNPGEPPGHRPPRGEKLGGALSGALSKEQRRHETDADREKSDDPIDGVKLHAMSSPYRGRPAQVPRRSSKWRGPGYPRRLWVRLPSSRRSAPSAPHARPADRALRRIPRRTRRSPRRSTVRPGRRTPWPRPPGGPVPGN